MNLIYLASLYSLESTPEIRQQRFERVVKLTGVLIKNGFNVVSPIVHNHPIALGLGLDCGWEFWKPYDECLLSKCDELFVLRDEGWDRSVGITAEIKLAQELNMSITYVEFDGENYRMFKKITDIKCEPFPIIPPNTVYTL